MTTGTRTTKTVQFPDEVATVVLEIPNREDFTTEDYENMWFSKTEYQVSRSECKIASRDAVRFGYSKNLDETFNEKNQDALDKLQSWAVSGATRRGLERWANRDHGEIRQTEQFKAVMAVLEAQDEMLSKDGVIDVEKLRKVSHKATKMARHFARMMGKADSYAVAHIDDENKDNETVASTSALSNGSDGAITIDSTDFGEDFSLASTAAVDEVAAKVSGISLKSRTKTKSPFSRFRFGSKKSNRSVVTTPT